MKEFILGIPNNGKEITTFDTMMNASEACKERCAIFAESLEKAKDKFMQLLINNFQPIK